MVDADEGTVVGAAPPGAGAWRGSARLAVEATLRTTELIEAMHAGIARPWAGFRGTATGRTRGITRLVYASVRAVTRTVGSAVDSALSAAPPLLDAGIASARGESLRAILNGVLGDHLAATGNSLAIPSELRHDGQALPLAGPADGVRRAIPAARGRILLLVHGLCRSDLQWRHDGHDRPAELAKHLGATAVYARYNSGLHVSTNGKALSDLLELLIARWPVEVEQLAIVGHSMGGLVARSACHHAALRGAAWPRSLRHLVFLGTPHHGAPLERAGRWLQLAIGAAPYARPLARLGALRSAGITDLRHGNLLDEDWQGRDRFAAGRDLRRAVPLPRDVTCCAVAATRSPRWSAGRRSTRGDGLVPVRSALGQHRDPTRDLGLRAERRHVVAGTGHLGLLASAEAWATLRRWLDPASREL